MKKLALVAAFIAIPLAAQAPPADDVSADRLRADVEKLVSFGTRHTLSSQTDPQRGIGAAVDWAAAELGRISAACGNCLEVMQPESIIEGSRVPTPTRLRNAVAIQRGRERPNEVIIVQAHIDSRVSDVADFASDAPGANDNASGSALVLEAARALSDETYPTTIIYALLSGEEQGLYGGTLLADWVEQQGYTVKAVLNNDVVGNSCGSDGYCDPHHVRVFSEGPRGDLTNPLRAAQRREGGENDSPSRNLSRWIDRLAEQDETGLDVRQIWRVDRMGRGGDQIPFLEAGYPAVRFSVAVEDYDHQHQDLRTEDGTTYGDTVAEMDFDYLAKVTQLNVRALERLAAIPLPPAPTAQAAVRTSTLIEWEPVAGAASYEVYRRRTEQPAWEAEPLVVVASAQNLQVDLTGVRGDDWFFGVNACSAQSACSPVASAVPAGQFAPVAVVEDDSD